MNIPIGRDFDPFDPTTITTVSPACDMNLSIVDYDLLVFREDDRAPEKSLVTRRIGRAGEYIRHWHGLNRETVAVLDILLPDLRKDSGKADVSTTCTAHTCML